MYSPDNWGLVKIDTDGKDPLPFIYKVIGGWSGGYLDGDSWRMNSGITKVTEKGDYILFSGFSGSVYECYRESEGLRGMAAQVFYNMKDDEIFKMDAILYEDFIKEFENVKQSDSAPVV